MDDQVESFTKSVHKSGEELYKVLHDQFPEIGGEIRSNIEKYGSPILGGTIGNLSAYGLPGHVGDLLDGPGIYNPLEINIRPAGPESNDYEMNWYILIPKDGHLRRAIDVERDSKNDIHGNGLRNS